MKRPSVGMVAGAILAVGVVLRVRQFVSMRPLWLDEARVSLNICLRSFAGLLHPLSLDQSAPIPFLWIEKVATIVGGVNEAALRALPFACGLALLFVFWRLASRLLDPPAALLALAVLAVSPTYIYFSNEVKPYGADALITVLVVLTLLPVLAEPVAPGPWRRLLGAGFVAALTSAPALLVFLGVLTALAAVPAIRNQPEGRRWLVLAALVWGGTFTAVYLAFYRSAATNPYLQLFWSPAFLSPLSHYFPGNIPTAIGRTLRGILLRNRSDIGSRASLILLIPIVPIVMGVLALRRERGTPVALACTVPLLAALAASAVDRYPIETKLMVFAGPLIIILTTAGLYEMSRRVGARYARPVFALAGCALLLVPAATSAAQFLHPPRRENLHALIQSFLRQRHPGDVVYLFGRSVPGWTFYTTNWKSPDVARLARMGDLVSSTGAAFRNPPSRGRPVLNEGRELAFRYRDWIELVGVPSGSGPSITSRGGAVADSGWAENEARRIRAAGGTDAWLVFTVFRRPLMHQLRSALEAHGGVLISNQFAEKAALLHIRFDSTGVKQGARSNAPSPQ